MTHSTRSIAGLGDSLTYGWEVQIGFFDRCIDRLSDHFDDLTIRESNFGVPGDTAKGGLARLPAILDQSPDLVTVQFGLNDCYAGVAVAEFRKQYHQIATEILSRGGGAVLVTSCPLLGEEELITPYYDAIRSVAQELHTPLADIDSYWSARKTPRDALEPLYLSDGVHPTDAGHSIMAEGLFETLREILSAEE